MGEESFKEIGKKLREQTYWFKGADIEIRPLLNQLKALQGSERQVIELEQRLRSSTRNLSTRLRPETKTKLKEKLEEGDTGLKVSVDGQTRQLPAGNFEAIVEYLETLRAQANNHEIELIDEQLQLALDELTVDQSLESGLTDALDDLHVAARSDIKRRQVLVKAISKAARKNCYDYINRYIDEQGVESLRDHHPQLISTIASHFECSELDNKSQRQSCFNTLTGLLNRIDSHWYQTQRDGEWVYNLHVFESASVHARKILAMDSMYAFCLAHTKIYPQKPIGHVVYQYFPEVYLEHAY